jgi:hypothetical protein
MVGRRALVSLSDEAEASAFRTVLSQRGFSVVLTLESDEISHTIHQGVQIAIADNLLTLVVIAEAIASGASRPSGLYILGDADDDLLFQSAERLGATMVLTR